MASTPAIWRYQRSVVGNVGHYRRPHEITAGKGQIAVDLAQWLDAGTATRGVVNEAIGPDLGFLGMQRAHRDGRLQAIAHDNRIDCLAELFEELVASLRRNVDALDRHADLTAHHECRIE